MDHGSWIISRFIQTWSALETEFLGLLQGFGSLSALIAATFFNPPSWWHMRGIRVKGSHSALLAATRRNTPFCKRHIRGFRVKGTLSALLASILVNLPSSKATYEWNLGQRMRSTCFLHLLGTKPGTFNIKCINGDLYTFQIRPYAKAFLAFAAEILSL